MIKPSIIDLSGIVNGKGLTIQMEVEGKEIRVDRYAGSRGARVASNAEVADRDTVFLRKTAILKH